MANVTPVKSPPKMAFKEHFEDDESPVSSSIIELQDPEKRPACFKSTIQECLFILTATMSIGTSSFLYGICSVITASIGRGLNMTSAEITWISASSAFVVSIFRSINAFF